MNLQHDIWSPKPFFIAGGFKEDSAAQEVARLGGDNVVVVFGRYFISNVRLSLPFFHSCRVEPKADFSVLTCHSLTS